MNRKEAEDYIYKSYLKAQRYQNFNDKDSKKRRPDLTKSIIEAKAGTPCAIITGSKGKGSVSAMISQILQTVYKIGMMTSPHLVDFCERIRINGKPISDEQFVKYLTMIQPEIDEIEKRIEKNVCISPMGIQTDLALTVFNNEHTDFNVMECGKGAQYDDVNNVKHEYAIINSIFLEHTRELGESIEEIAADKAHVITEGLKCVYVAEQTEEALKVIKKRANIYNIPVKYYGTDFQAQNIHYRKDGMFFDITVGKRVIEGISIPLLGEHQAKNCAIAMALCLDIVPNLNIQEAKRNLSEIEWPGRMEVISSEPFILLDACINKFSCRNVRTILDHIGINEAIIIIGIPDDKDYMGVIQEMTPCAESIILTKSQNPHYFFSEKQCKNAREKGIMAKWTNSLDEALGIATRKNKPIAILGTTSVISEVKKMDIKELLRNESH